MAETKKLFVAHEADLATLREHWAAARSGDARAVLLQAPVGGGKRAMVGELCRGAAGEDGDVLVWRVPFGEEEDGLQTLLKMYAGLFSGLHRDATLRGKVEMALNSQLPNQPKRVQGWYQAFIEGLKKGAPNAEGQMQVILPRDNPLIGLVEIATAIARKFPVILEIQNTHFAHSVGIHALIEALVAETFAQDDSHMLLLLSMESVDDQAKLSFPLPLLDLLDRRADDLDRLVLSPWGSAEVDAYLASRELSGAGARIAEVVDGRPGFIAELTDWLKDNDKLDGDLAGFTLADVADVTPDADELGGDEDEATEAGAEAEAGKRKKATAEDAERVAHLAALLGVSFPSGLVADMAGYDRESIDDLLDASEDLYKELQFSEPLGTWVYQFNKALLRESVLARHTSDEDKETARRVAAFMDRFFSGRGYAYLIKSLKLMANAGIGQRATMLRSMALGADQAQVWAMCHDLVKFYDDVEWPAAMRRTVYMSLIDRMVQGGDVNQTETLWNEAMAWADTEEDRPMKAWLLFAGSRLDFRRQDLYRSRDRANDALKLYGSLEDKLKGAEINNHLAMIEMADGAPNAALDRVKAAEELAAVPPIQAHAAFVRGLVSRRAKKLPDAITHFQKANELAGKAGVAGLALDAGVNLGEVLLVSRQTDKAADVLAQVVQIAKSMRNAPRERTATSLLGQAHAALGNYEAALQQAARTLELTKALKYERLIAVDMYNMGLFNLMLGRSTEAVSLLKQARSAADATDAGFQKELTFNLGNALLQIGEHAQAEEALRASLGPSTAAKDWRKVMKANEQLSGLEEGRGNAGGARNYLEAAVKAAEAGNLRDERKALRKKLGAL